jgi:hypothetical protein
MATSMSHRRRSPNSHPLNSLATANLLSTKGATFHSPSAVSPLSDYDDTDDAAAAVSPAGSGSSGFFPPRFARARSSPEDLIDASRCRAAAIISRIDRQLSDLKLSGLSEMVSPVQGKKNGGDDDGDSSEMDSADEGVADVLPLPPSFLALDRCELVRESSSSTATTSSSRRRRIAVSRTAAAPDKGKGPADASDSGLGTSLASTKDRLRSAASAAAERPDGAAAAAAAAASLVGSADATTMDNGAAPAAGLGPRAVARILEHIVRPMLAKRSLRPFRAMLEGVPARMAARRVCCLRDLEKVLWFSAQTKARSTAVYIDFLVTAIGCIQKTAALLDATELVRGSDAPYTPDYFSDLKEQLFQTVAEMTNEG